MTIVYLVRHAAHDQVDAVLCGRTPGVMLGERGRAQAAAVAARLRNTGAVSVLTSPMDRARQTASPIAAALGLTPEVEPALNEIDFGDWTGRCFATLDPDPTWRSWNLMRAQGRVPNGESMIEAQERIGCLIGRLGDADAGPTILVSHCDVLRAAVLAVLGLSLDAYDRITIDPASVSTLSVWSGGGKVMGLNEHVPLDLHDDKARDARRHGP